MARLLWCRHEDCQRVYVSQAGSMPRICPECRRGAQWTTTAPMDRDDVPPIEWLPIDRLILLYLGIGP